jgi:4-hydroxy-tetrahydrodipicolinate synthase
LLTGRKTSCYLAHGKKYYSLFYIRWSAIGFEGCFGFTEKRRLFQKLWAFQVGSFFMFHKKKRSVSKMKQVVFTGSAVAIVTPFTETGVDYTKLEELIEYQIKEGTDAIVICGTTGEASTMPDEEHQEAIRFTVATVKGRLPVIAGTGSNDTRHAVELSHYAETVGADAILTVSPYYNKTTQKGLYEHFRLIAQSVAIPVILYNVPSRTNLNIDPQTIKALAQLENIAGVKECNFAQVGEVINLCGGDITVYSGEDALILPMLALGGQGVISVMANIIPRDTHDLVARFMAGDLTGSRQIQLKALNLLKALFSEVNPIPVKAAMNLLGMRVGKCRLPLVEMGEVNANLLKAELVKYGLL